MSVSAGTLGPVQRLEALERLATEEFDVVVVGGGVTGAGVALDAATRGLSVALLERRDFAAGTSSRSSKLLHGGLRYLEQRNFALVREALHERSLILTRLAPHLARAVPFVYPLQHRVWERAYVGTGIALYDALGGRVPAVPRHRHLSRSATLAIAPSLDPAALVGSVRYYDGQVDDARFVTTLVRTAAAHGAVCVSAVGVHGFQEAGGRLVAAEVVDAESGRGMRVRGRTFISATGVWTTRTEQLAKVEKPLQVLASKGVHLLVPRGRIDSETAWVVRTEKSVLFLIPWNEHWVIGTTDTPWDLDLDHPSATAEDLGYLLEHVNRVLRPDQSRLTVQDVVGVYVGLRPLVVPPTHVDRDTTKISREHVVRASRPGFVTVAGGKYTTYRVMAADAVDLAVRQLPFPVQASRTEHVPLLGADGFASAAMRARQHQAASLVGPLAIEHLVRRFGSCTTELLDLVVADPALAQPIPGAGWYVLAEAHYAASAEGALHVDDVLTRRTRVSIEAQDRGAAAAGPVADVLARVLGWSSEQRDAEVSRYHDRLEAERQSLTAHDDTEADSRRTQVRDPRVTT